MSQKQTILVSGGAGFIGTNLIRFIIESSDHNVVNVDKLTYAGSLNSLHDLENHPRYQFEKIDINHDQDVHQVFRNHQPTWVIHLAAESHVDRSIATPERFIQTNIIGTLNLLQASLRHSEQLDHEPAKAFRFIHVSTDEVYGSLSLTDSPRTELCRYEPNSPYSASKAAADHLVRAWHQTYGLPVLITNSSNNYGPYQYPEKLIPVVITNALSGDPIPVYGTGENIRDWIYVVDHVRALLAVAEQGKIGATYNVGAKQEVSNLDLVRKVCSLLDELAPIANNPRFTEKQKNDTKSYDELITFVKDRPGHDFRYALDVSKMETELNWSPQADFDSAMRKTVQWYLENESWYSNALNRNHENGCNA